MRFVESVSFIFHDGRKVYYRKEGSTSLDDERVGVKDKTSPRT